ncbi:hypothetical protein W02_35920 [Nitrospira sp. KM1]|uniref:hypothetical protein n=1 Tax=Nitrospira sp. KM1 TaxID=1936990 RepID=UPI0013A72C90|nr:hypothetical protein [Nitrospira sp. KM1]BCA56452.1 hypothetical protein W02_35920 [Nitrospira sp. KM1]
MKTHRLVMIGLALLAAAGCAGTVAKERKGQQPDAVVDMLHRGVIELNGNIDELKEHIDHLEHMPAVKDPRMQELLGLDIVAWQLHLQQWVVQRDHLLNSLASIQRVKAAPQDKATVGTEWSTRQATFVKTVEELKTHRRKLEQKRSEMESHLLEQYFK